MSKKVIKICIFCEKQFQVFLCESSKKYCSKNCYSSAQIADTEIQCQFCSKSFLVKPFFKDIRQYCSNECRSLSRRKREIKKCLFCKKNFTAHVYETETKKYCSTRCYYSTLAANSQKTKKNCLTCKKEFKVFPHLDNKNFCSRVCYKNFSEKNSNWKNCAVCKSEFIIQPYEIKRGRKCCSRKCSNAIRNNSKLIKCLSCENKISVCVSQLGSKKYCSNKCYFNSASRNETDIERKLRLALEEANLPHEIQFNIGKHFVDFAIVSNRLAIEADGDYWHKDKTRDLKRDNILEKQGWRVIRFSGTQIKKDIKKCLSEIQKAL